MSQGFDVYGVDLDPSAIAAVRELAATQGIAEPKKHFTVAPVEDIPYKDETFDLVISSAVLHFAKNLSHFESMLNSMWRCIKPGGYLF
ncbi:class I SAM-dependent methyltransferase [Pedobacter ginsenosidimutans]|uniref:class I SAM-dependent methyltransferase n=1 Tax=Pedobacter ginsenosidimutans TaxID=687842 RepID=UPI001FD7F89D